MKTLEQLLTDKQNELYERNIILSSRNFRLYHVIDDLLSDNYNTDLNDGKFDAVLEILTDTIKGISKLEEEDNKKEIEDMLTDIAEGLLKL